MLVAAYLNSKMMHLRSILLGSSFTDVQRECKLSATEEVQFA